MVNWHNFYCASYDRFWCVNHGWGQEARQSFCLSCLVVLCLLSLTVQGRCCSFHNCVVLGKFPSLGPSSSFCKGVGVTYCIGPVCAKDACRPECGLRVTMLPSEGANCIAQYWPRVLRRSRLGEGWGNDGNPDANVKMLSISDINGPHLLVVWLSPLFAI